MDVDSMEPLTLKDFAPNVTVKIFKDSDNLKHQKCKLDYLYLFQVSNIFNIAACT